jgi:hypothetical protein
MSHQEDAPGSLGSWPTRISHCWALSLVMLACAPSHTSGQRSTIMMAPQPVVMQSPCTTRVQIAMALYEALMRRDFGPLEAHIPSVAEIQAQDPRFSPQAYQVWRYYLSTTFQDLLTNGPRDYGIDWSRIAFRGAGHYGFQCTLVFDHGGQTYTAAIDDCKWMPGRGWTLGDYFKGVVRGINGTMLPQNGPDIPEGYGACR